jgi:hypothetical protein
MFKKNFVLAMAAFMALSAATPALAFARNGSDDNDDRGRQESRHAKDDERKFGVEIHDDHGKSDRNKESLAPKGIAKGKILTKTDTGFTVVGKRDVSYTVNTAGAVITRIPNTVITLADLAVGDFVSVQGTKTDTTIAATKVFVIPVGIHKAEAKGTVTAVNGNTITMLTKKGFTATVNTDANTKFIGEHHTPMTLTDVIVGSKLKVEGIWDTLVNTINAFKVRLK